MTAAVAVACTDRISTKGGGTSGEAGFTEISVPGDVRTLDVRVSPDERTIVITTSGGHGYSRLPKIVVYDAALRRVSDTELVAHDVAFASDGRRIVAGVGTLAALALPELRATAGPPSAGVWPTAHMLAFSTDGVQRIVERPGASGWFAAARRGEDGVVEILDDATLSIGRKGKFGAGSLRAAALDTRTGRLVLLLKPNHMESFDTQEMRSVARIDLPCASIGFSVAVADGVAFVPTEQGTVLVVNAGDGTLLRTVETGGRQVMLSMSRSGGMLAVSTRELQGDGTTRVGLLVFERHGAALTPVAETVCTLKHAPNDVAVIEGSRTVILTGDETLAWHY